MSREARGDEDDNEYACVDSLIDAGWWPSEQAQEVTDAIKALCSERMYKNNWKEDGVSVRFLMRMTMLKVAAGLTPADDMFAKEAAAYFASEIRAAE